MQLVINLTSTFMLGLLTPLTAVAVISVLLIFNVDAGKIFPQARIPSVKNAYLSALSYDFYSPTRR